MSEHNRVSLTVYDQGQALIRDRRVLELRAGLNEVLLDGIAARIDTASLNILSLSDPLGTQAVELAFRYDPIGRDTLLTRFLHEPVEVTLDDGTTYSGELCGGRDAAQPTRFGSGDPHYDLALRQRDGQLVLIRPLKVREVRVPQNGTALYTRPVLRVLLETQQTGPQQIELTYLTQGLGWTIDYNLVLPQQDSGRVHLNGWVTIINGSGMTFENAQVRLVQEEMQHQLAEEGRSQQSGLLRRISPPSRFGNEPEPPPPPKDQPAATAQHSYTLKRPVSLGIGETRQFEFYTARGVAVRRLAVCDASPRLEGGYPAAPIKKSSDPATTTGPLMSRLALQDGLSMDLPSGTLRVYQEQPQREPDLPPTVTLAAETRLERTPQGSLPQFTLGPAGALNGKRVQTSYRQVSRLIAEETIAITLTNSDPDRPAPVLVQERLFRWHDWEILSASHDYEQIDSTTIAFQVVVPPMGRTVIDYIVRYLWPS